MFSSYTKIQKMSVKYKHSTIKQGDFFDDDGNAVAQETSILIHWFLFLSLSHALKRMVKTYVGDTETKL